MASRFRVKMADVVIEIQPLTSDLADFCMAYRTDEAPDLSVALVPEDLARERRLATVPASDAYLETLALNRRTADALLWRDTILLHASCVAVDGAGYLFTADSGVGKSTHARLWREMLGERAMMINDDKPFVRIRADGLTAYGSPWDGIHHLSANASVPVRGIGLLNRDTTNHIAPIDPEEAFPVLLEQTYRPEGRAAMERVLALVDRMSRQIPLYTLGCDMSPEAARISYEGMRSCG